VPYQYRISDFYNAVQWAAGLELFLLVKDPMQVFFTTDHPNGAPFTTYPDLFALLMSADKRAEMLSRLPVEVKELTNLSNIKREYTLYEIATMTRAAPRKLYGLKDRGELGEGSIADVAVYKIQKDRAEMFRNPSYVFKDGKLVVRDGKVIHYTRGKTLYVKPEYDRQINKRLNEYYDEEYGVSRTLFSVSEDSLPNREHFNQISCLT